MTKVVRSRWVTPSITAAVLTLLVLGPAVVHPGFSLVGDMVFVPDGPWHSGYLGLDGSLPRAVPTDAVVWALGLVLPGAAVQKALLALVVVVATLGMFRLLRDSHRVAQVVASVAFVWTPYTHDRLAIGQWSLLMSAATLPWIVASAKDYAESRDTRSGALLGLWLAFAAIFSPSGGLTAVAVALAIVLAAGAGWRASGVVLGLGVGVNLPWLVPGLISNGATPSVRASVEAFAARAESGLGLLPSVLTGGGIWKASIIADERSAGAVQLLALAFTLLGLVGAWLGLRRDRAAVGLAAVAALGVLLTLVTAWAPEVLTAVIEAIPGLGVLRDTTRYLAPLCLLVAWGIGSLVSAAILRRRQGSAVLALVLVVWPLLALPSLAWGLWGKLSPVDYPDDWFDTRQAVSTLESEGPMVVLPWHGTYRRFPWNDDRAGLDPAPRFMPGQVLIDDRVFLRGVSLANEEPRLDAVTQALASPDPVAALTDLGVRAILVEHTTPGGDPQAKSLGLDPGSPPAGATVAHAGSELVLWRLPDYDKSQQNGRLSPLQRTVIVLGDVMSISIAIACAWRHRIRTDTLAGNKAREGQ